MLAVDRTWERFSCQLLGIRAQHKHLLLTPVIKTQHRRIARREANKIWGVRLDAGTEAPDPQHHLPNMHTISRVLRACGKRPPGDEELKRSEADTASDDDDEVFVFILRTGKLVPRYSVVAKLRYLQTGCDRRSRYAT